ncbi:Adenylyl cyclase-associated protein 2 [Camelus dromedarius]|uniref:Adenylyl cyclase-associated protein 2 n=1 Tax=Camelus dromedarius TaxID=9838 RepID=A0A5N4CRE6_CAMDR|nr:Adenylyl cyclase-associated protein 2 [Camelus dromedarius]
MQCLLTGPYSCVMLRVPKANPDSVPGLPKQIHDAQVYPWVPSVNREPHILIGRLRHVTDDQKTYKNPSLRTQGGQTPSPTKSHSPSPKSPQSHPPKKHAPVLELEGKKWRVEYQEGRNDLVISETELRQVAYIFKCSKSTLQMKGKINSITIDNCKKFGLVFDNVVGIVEVINSKDIQMQVMGRVPTISINKTEGCHIYLSEDALDCEIVSAKSSEMNVLIPQDGDYREFPVPEQFKTAWDGSKLVTEPTEIMVSERPPKPLS